MSLESNKDNQSEVNCSPLLLDDGNTSTYASSYSKPVSQLWTKLSRIDSVEIETGLVNPAEMERLHGICLEKQTNATQICLNHYRFETCLCLCHYEACSQK